MDVIITIKTETYVCMGDNNNNIVEDGSIKSPFLLRELRDFYYSNNSLSSPTLI